MLPVASNSSLPPPLATFCQNPPWRVSSILFNRAPSYTNLIYKKIQVLPSDPEYQFIWKYFYHQQPTNRAIKAIYFIHNVRLGQGFEQYVSKMEMEAKQPGFEAKWRDEEPKLLRQRVAQRFQKLASPYTPFTIPWDKEPETCHHVKVLPLWHGSTRERCEAICQTGFHTFGKHALLGKGGNNQSTDTGYFGSGIYFTTSARYAADVYSKNGEHLLLGWVAMREPYPVVNDQPLSPLGYPQVCSDMTKLQALGAYERYNAHYIPVVPANRSLDCQIFYPCPQAMDPVWDEIVVFQNLQPLCRFWVEMQVDLTKIVPKATISVGQALDFMIKLADHQELQKYPTLREGLKSKIDALAYLSEDNILEPENSELYELCQGLILVSNKINENLVALLMKNLVPNLLPHQLLAASKPINPFYSRMTDKMITQDKVKKIPLSEFIAAIEKEPYLAVLYFNLARALPLKKSVQLNNGTQMTKQQLYLKAIDLDPKNSLAYSDLGATLPAGGSVQLFNGTQMTQQQLCLKAIDLDPKNSFAYHDLGVTLPTGGSIQLLNGTQMTEQQLFLKAIDLNPNTSLAYYNLGATLPAGGSVQLFNGTQMTQQQLYLKVIDLDPKDSFAYYNLGATLLAGGSVQLFNGTQMTQQQLYLKAIELNPKDSVAYRDLGATLPAGGSIQLPDETTMTTQELYLKAIELNPNDSVAYRALGSIFSPGGMIRLPNGTTIPQQRLLLKAIELNPNDSVAYSNLGNTLQAGLTIQLPNGQKMNQQELLLKAIELDPENSFAYRRLGTTLPAGWILKLPDGTTMTKQQLLNKY